MIFFNNVWMIIVQNSYDKISIIIPVLHEEETISHCIDHIFSAFNSHTTVTSDDASLSPELIQPSVSIEVIVVDGDQDGSTINIIKRSGVKTLISDPGRGTQMNAGLDASTGDIFLFAHVDTILPRDPIQLILSTLNDPNIDGGAFSLGIDSRRKSLRFIAAMTTFRSQVTKIPYGDQAIFIRRSVFKEIGGFREIPIMEDLDLMRRCRKAGYRIKILREKVITSARRWEREGVIRCTLRNWRVRSGFLLGVSPDKLVRSYNVHRAPRHS